MANNCFNNIIISGDTQDLERIADMAKEGYEKLISNFDHEQSGDNPKWFDISCIDLNKDELVISGDSAWRPALELFAYISERYKSIQIMYQYEEMGCDFAGYADIKNGTIDDHCYDYWTGIIKSLGEDEALTLVFENELECYDRLKDLVDSSMYNAFSPEYQEKIKEAYNE